MTVSDFEFIVMGKPIAKKRPRFFRRGKFVGTYSDQESEEGNFMLMIMSQLPENPRRTIQNAIKLEMEFGLPIPKSISKKKKSELISNGGIHIKKPDLDNLEKFVMDCFTRLQVWKDDCQIVELKSKKFYTENPYTEIRISEIDSI